MTVFWPHTYDTKPVQKWSQGLLTYRELTHHNRFSEPISYFTVHFLFSRCLHDTLLVYAVDHWDTLGVHGNGLWPVCQLRGRLGVERLPSLRRWATNLARAARAESTKQTTNFLVQDPCPTPVDTFSQEWFSLILFMMFLYGGCWLVDFCFILILVSNIRLCFLGLLANLGCAFFSVCVFGWTWIFYFFLVCRWFVFAVCVLKYL